MGKEEKEPMESNANGALSYSEKVEKEMKERLLAKKHSSGSSSKQSRKSQSPKRSQKRGPDLVLGNPMGIMNHQPRDPDVRNVAKEFIKEGTRDKKNLIFLSVFCSVLHSELWRFFI